MVELDKILKKDKINLEDVHELYKKWITIHDIKRIDIGLALRILGRTTGAVRVWLIFIGASGDWKSEQLLSLNDPEECKILQNFTSKTLVNGSTKFPDLAPKLRDKTIIILDMAQLLKLNPNEKGEVWAQLRDLYDGIAGKQSGMGKDVMYKDLNVSLLAASTPAIDTQILIHQDLGTRELLWRCMGEEKVRIMNKVWDNENCEDLMRLELNEVNKLFLKDKEYDEHYVITDNVKMFLENQAIKLAYLRAAAQVDSYSGELLSDVIPEQPTRVLKQLKRVYVALKCLDPDYLDSRAFDVIEHLVMSSGVTVRKDVLNVLNNIGLCTTFRVAETLKIGFKTAFRELNILWNMGLVNRIARIEQRGFKDVEICEWELDKSNGFVSSLFDNYKIPVEEDVKDV